MIACTPHPGLGTVVIARPAYVQVVNLATCASARERPAPPSPSAPVVKGNAIVLHEKVIVRARKGDSIALAGTTPDRGWILYSIDRFASASLAADGLTLRAIRAGGGPSYPIATALVYASYRSWCGARLVVTAGFDRDTTTHKWLVTSAPPTWRARILFRDARRAFGSLTCARDGVIVQSTAASDTGFCSPNWALWHVAWDGSLRRLTSPPAGTSDESPEYAAGVLYFVRSGSLYALRSGRLLGPLVRIPRVAPEYFGHTDWRYSIRR